MQPIIYRPSYEITLINRRYHYFGVVKDAEGEIIWSSIFVFDRAQEALIDATAKADALYAADGAPF
ncbi:MAG TPA: hypothetical protein PKE27_23035 [Povalibacter sp.]|uniref:hypothetical protein n=1 Tax=Povalibacter sp. TaxID=1962978 RepID=UPI002C534E63|nr:hypothetical protein [Povalibacter sp.]HMN47467.1 hypothetical protein [Povalibacter sp.]